MEKGEIFDIQRFAVHDGPGIRTTVFFKGCSCKCVWCHNPESLSPKPQVAFYPSRCIGCGHCFDICPRSVHFMDGQTGAHCLDRAKCAGCGACAGSCYSDALVLEGKTATLGEVMGVVLADKLYYEESGGGITLSGGEPVLQAGFAKAILAECKAHGIHTALQTAGNYAFEKLEPLLPYLDLVMYDIKAYTPELYDRYVSCSRELVFENLRRLAGKFGGVLAARTPCVRPINDNPEEISAIAKTLSEIGNIAYYQLIPYHGLAKVKYDALGTAFAAECSAPPSETMRELEAAAERYIKVFRIMEN